MCIIIYKPTGEKFPSKKTLKRCFEANPHGAGLMVADGEYVHIRKGLMSFTAFYKALQKTRQKYGDNAAYVLHFRISTQAGIRADNTHPFPLSSDMAALRELSTVTPIGIAHNGIISLTSYGGYFKQITYNDTMLFITDYLSLIIQSLDYYKDKKTLKLIERLCGSRLALLDGGGHCELIGNGWTKDGGVWYSNSSYKTTTATKKATYTPLYDWEDDEDEYADIQDGYEDGGRFRLYDDEGGETWTD